MELIKLPNGQWHYDPNQPLGPAGGFGQVFAGLSDKGVEVAVKRIKIDAKQAAHREMRIAEELTGKDYQHIIPVYDAGLDAESDNYFVVMAKASHSLQDKVGADFRYSDEDTASIMLSIATGLSEVPEFVHRDMKPGNVLLHEGKWKIADFGIAKFVEESTSLQTLKDCLSPPYAAPEQWKLEQVGQFTDIYALGCIGYTLLTGNPPFLAPTTESYQNQHLHNPPPPLHGHRPELQSLLSTLLRKNTVARPSLDRVLNRLKTLSETASGKNQIVGVLANADAKVAQRVGVEEARETQRKAAIQRQQQLTKTGYEILDDIRSKFFSRIEDQAQHSKRSDIRVSLGSAEISFEVFDRWVYPCTKMELSGWHIAAGAKIVVRQSQPSYEWSSSLWYTGLKEPSKYRWYEVSYMTLGSKREKYEPFAADLDIADRAAGIAMDVYQIAYGPKPIDDEDQESFFNRWETLYARGANGEIEYPRRLPLPPNWNGN